MVVGGAGDFMIDEQIKELSDEIDRLEMKVDEKKQQRADLLREKTKHLPPPMSAIEAFARLGLLT
jgi:putative NADH-flavin reductase